MAWPKGKPRSAGDKTKISNAMRGRSQSDKTRAAIGASVKAAGRQPRPESPQTDIKRASGRKAAATHRKRRPEQRAASLKAWYETTGREWSRDYQLRKTYGISRAEYLSRLADQRGVCAICGKAETAQFKGKIKELAVDHEHASGLIRGLLCSNCNRGLGCFGDDVEMLRHAVAYLDRRVKP